jgi:hypothetical protein
MDMVIVMDISASAYFMWEGVFGETGERGLAYAINEFILGLPENIKSLSLVMFNKDSIVPEGLTRTPSEGPEGREAAADRVLRAIGEQFEKTRDEPRGTNIGGAVTGAAAEMGVGGPALGRPVVMVMITDSWNSESTRDSQPGYKNEILSYPQDDMFFYMAEIADQAYIDAYVDKNSEIYIPMDDVAERFGGEIRRVLTLDGARAGLTAIREAISLIPDPSDPEPEQEPEPGPETETEPGPAGPAGDEPPAPVSPGVLLSVDFPENPAEGMLAGADLSVSARIPGANGLPVSDPAEYEKYNATFWIRHEADRSFFPFGMNPQRDMNTFEIELDESGRYDFYVTLTSVDGEFFIESRHMEIYVHERSGIDGIMLTAPRSLIMEPGGSSEKTFPVRAVFNESYASAGPGAGNTYKMYYDTYSAAVAVEPGGLRFPMETDGESYYAAIPAGGDGLRDFRVEVSDQAGETVYEAAGFVVIVRDSYWVITALLAAAAAVMYILALRLFTSRVEFAVSVSDRFRKIPNVLVFCSKGNFRGGKASAKDIFKAVAKAGPKFIIPKDSVFKELAGYYRNSKSKANKTKMISGKSFTENAVGNGGAKDEYRYSVTVYCAGKGGKT